MRIGSAEVADAPSKAREIAERIGPKVVLKAQVRAGGRGKGGGIRVAENPEDAEYVAASPAEIGSTLQRALKS